MPTEFELSSQLQEEIDRLLGNSEMTEFGPLREHEILVAAALKIKLNKESELVPQKGPPASLVKFNDLTKLFTNKQYVIAVDAYFWQHANMLQKRAALHKALMQIEVQETENGLKFKTRKPDINEFAATLVRFGPPVSEAMQRILPMLVTAGQQLAATLTMTSSSDGEPAPE